MSKSQLTESYRKARRMYGIFSSFLLAWELIGIRIDPSPLEEVDITIKNPEAAPYVLLSLVLYFAYRISIEWSQSPRAARRRRISRIDFAVSHAIALSSFVIFFYQSVYDYSIFEIVGDNSYIFNYFSLFSIIFYGSFVISFSYYIYNKGNIDKRNILFVSLIFSLFAVSISYYMSISAKSIIDLSNKALIPIIVLVSLTLIYMSE